MTGSNGERKEAQREEAQAEAEGLRFVSYGGGVQSTALLVLAATGRIDYRSFLFANVGDDSEHPDTLRYLRDVAVPFGREHGLEMGILYRRRRDGSIDTLRQRLLREQRSIAIPVRMAPSGAPGRRKCTADWTPGEIKRHATGNGNAAKSQVIHAAFGRWWPYGVLADVPPMPTDNEADALWVADLARLAIERHIADTTASTKETT